MNNRKTLLVMAGGTGGHVFPGLAVADKLKQQGWHIYWLGTADRMEAQLVPEHGYCIDFIDIAGVRGNGLKRMLLAPFKIIKSIMQARRVLKQRNIKLVLGMGGFASGPGGVAAWSMGIPVILHEQNAAMGLTNRILSHFANKVLLGFSAAVKTEKAVLVGNPVREKLINLPEKTISSEENPLKVLIVGGSLGAKALNELLPKVAKEFTDAQITIIHQTGKMHYQSVKQDYQDNHIEADVRAFISDMDEVYRWADLIICRAGALTVAEVAVVGLPAIFVPLPHAVDDHQTKNAQQLVDLDAAVLIPQNQLNDDLLRDYLRKFSENRELLKVMSSNCRKAAITDATERVATICNQLITLTKK